jgi:hypothetical protein
VFSFEPGLFPVNIQLPNCDGERYGKILLAVSVVPVASVTFCIPFPINSNVLEIGSKAIVESKAEEYLFGLDAVTVTSGVVTFNSFELNAEG